MWWTLLVFTLYVQYCVPQVQYFNNTEVIYEIAGIFEMTAQIQTRAFNESASKASLDNRRLIPSTIKPQRTDSYFLWRELCTHEEIRPIAIFGPQTTITDGGIRDQCAKAQIPHLQAAWQPFDPDLSFNQDEEEIDPYEYIEEEEEQPAENKEAVEEETPNEEPILYKNISINFYPDANEIAMAYASLLKHYAWDNFAALYEDDFGLLRIQKILAEYTDRHPIFVRKLEPGGENHKVFKELKKYQESRILLDCHVDNIPEYMDIAQTVGLINNYQHYIFVSLDASVHANKLLALPTNSSWFSMSEYDKLNDTQHFLASRVGAWKENGGSPPVSTFQLEALLMVDMTYHVIKSIRELEKIQDIDKIDSPKYAICEKDAEPWSDGAALQNQMLTINSTGVTGNIQFDETGKRFNYTLYVNEIHLHKYRTTGRWQSIAFTANNTNEVVVDTKVAAIAEQGPNKQFIVISRKNKPYFQDKQPCTEQPCPEDDGLPYEGFSVDLVKEIFKILHDEFNLNYTFKFVHEKDLSYGHYDEHSKKWDGLIGELLDNRADLAVCDLTITEERKKVVDFSVPIMNLGISVLYVKDHKVVPGMFSFLNPYSLDVWMHTATAYFLVSMVLFICARISPPDWENPQPCDKDPEELENIWNFKNCAWLTLGSIMTQGCDILPKAFGSRWVCSMWWFFAVIVCQTYIAQLSASMTSALESEPINSVDDLAKQNKILYGAISSGSTINFFKNSKDKMYRSIYETMMANDAVLVKTNDEGEKRVLKNKGKYAFFMESVTIEYKIKRECKLKKVGGQLDSKDYGIAMPANSPFRTEINRAILRLKELTILSNITDTWWNKKYGATEECSSDVNEDDVEGDLEWENLIGAFVVLIVGLVFCLFITAAEFMDEVRNIVVREQITHKEAFIQELKASLNFFQLQKPVLKNPSRAPSVVSGKSQLEQKQERRAQAISNFMDLEKIQQ